MRKKKKTIILAKIRRYIRKAIVWYLRDEGTPYFYTTNTLKANRVRNRGADYDDFYFVKSSKAVEELAEKIYDIIKPKRRRRRPKRFRW